MKRLLIIGASILQLPAIVKAKEMGFYVGVVDYNPSAIGIGYADEFFNISTIDTEGILKTAKSFKPNGIVTLATDMPMRSIAMVTKDLELSGISIEAAIKATDKGKMIKAFEENAVAAPWFFIIKNQLGFFEIKETIIYPCVIKPTDNSGSRGVILVEKASNLLVAYEYSKNHSRNGEVIIEEFLTGKEVSVEVMVVRKEIQILAITDKITTGPPYFVEMGHSQPSQLSYVDQEKIKDLTIKAVKAIEIENGPAHVEIMHTKDGPKMIEIGARMGGDNIATHLVPLSTGIDMVKATIDLATGKTPDLTSKVKKGSAIRYFDVPEGKTTSIDGIEKARQIKGIKEIVINKKVGEKVSKIQNSNQRFGFVIAQGKEINHAINLCKKAIDLIKIEVTSPY